MKNTSKNAELPQCDKTAVICSACGSQNSIKWDKHTIGIDDKKGSYRDLCFNFCEECGDVTNVEFS
jgi:hypothetical protein